MSGLYLMVICLVIGEFQTSAFPRLNREPRFEVISRDASVNVTIPANQIRAGITPTQIRANRLPTVSRVPFRRTQPMGTSDGPRRLGGSRRKLTSFSSFETLDKNTKVPLKKAKTIPENGLESAGTETTVSKIPPRYPREIDHSFSDYDRTDGEADFYRSDENYEDSQEVDAYYFEEIEKEEETLVGTGYDEALASTKFNADTELSSKVEVKDANQIARIVELSAHVEDQGESVQIAAKFKKAQTAAKKTTKEKEKGSHKKTPSKEKSKSKTKATKGSTNKKGPVAGKKGSASNGPRFNASAGQIESLLTKLNTLIGDIEDKEGDEVPVNIGKGIIYPKGNKTGDCTVLNHAPITSGFKGYVNYMSTRILGALPYIIEGEESFLLRHLDKTSKRHNNKVSVELTSKSCHCIRFIDVKPVQIDRERHAIITAFTLEYFNGGWNYIHDDNGRIKEFSVDTWKPSADHVVDLGRRIYATAIRVFPLDWKRLPWVRLQPLECPR